MRSKLKIKKDEDNVDKKLVKYVSVEVFQEVR